MRFPVDQRSKAQNFNLFRKLREWRKLHETTWERPPLLDLNHTPAEIEKLQKELDNRGGSKSENVYDVIKHKKKKMRVHAVLDQRANSVADLAAVLIAQDENGVETQKWKDENAAFRRKEDVRRMLEMAKEAQEGVLETIEARIQELSTQLQANKSGNEKETSNTQLRTELKGLHGKKRKTLFSMEAVAKVTEIVNNEPGAQSLTPEQRDARIAEQLPPFPRKQYKGMQSTLEDSESGAANAKVKLSELPKRGHLRSQIMRELAPVFSSKDVVIKWANQLDAEYAEAWPEAVTHEPMGLTRHRAPHANDEAVMGVAELREKKKSARDERNEAQAALKTQEDAVRERMLQRVKQIVAEKGREERKGQKEEALVN